MDIKQDFLSIGVDQLNNGDKILQMDAYNARLVGIKAIQEMIWENRKQQSIIEAQQVQIHELKTMVEKLIQLAEK